MSKQEADFNRPEYTKMKVVTDYRAWRYEHESFLRYQEYGQYTFMLELLLELVFEFEYYFVRG